MRRQVIFVSVIQLCLLSENSSNMIQDTFYGTIPPSKRQLIGIRTKALDTPAGELAFKNTKTRPIHKCESTHFPIIKFRI